MARAPARGIGRRQGDDELVAAALGGEAAAKEAKANLKKRNAA